MALYHQFIQLVEFLVGLNNSCPGCAFEGYNGAQKRSEFTKLFRKAGFEPSILVDALNKRYQAGDERGYGPDAPWGLDEQGDVGVDHCPSGISCQRTDFIEVLAEIFTTDPKSDPDIKHYAAVHSLIEKRVGIDGCVTCWIIEKGKELSGPFETTG